MARFKHGIRRSDEAEAEELVERVGFGLLPASDGTVAPAHQDKRVPIRELNSQRGQLPRFVRREEPFHLGLNNALPDTVGNGV